MNFIEVTDEEGKYKMAVNIDKITYIQQCFEVDIDGVVRPTKKCFIRLENACLSPLETYDEVEVLIAEVRNVKREYERR